MIGAQSNTTTLANSQKILAKDIHAKWPMIPEREASRMKAKSDIVAQLQTRYSLSQKQAQMDVESWANNRNF